VYVDSHCHLNRLDFSQTNLQQVLLAAKAQGVDHFLCVAITLAEHPELVEIASNYPFVSISAGLHPNESPGQVITKEALLALASDPHVVAVGETGLDYYRAQEGLAWQKDRFSVHIECAKACGKPLIIHSRAAKKDTLAMMRTEKATKGVLHCFTEDWEMAKQAMDMNFYISFSGIVTFKNALLLQEVAKKIPLDRMLIETDSPYLAPVPHRGQSNVPAWVSHVAQCIADLRKISVEEVARQTTENFFNLFSLAKR